MWRARGGRGPSYHYISINMGPAQQKIEQSVDKGVSHQEKDPLVKDDEAAIEGVRAEYGSARKNWLVLKENVKDHSVVSYELIMTVYIVMAFPICKSHSKRVVAPYESLSFYTVYPPRRKR